MDLKALLAVVEKHVDVKGLEKDLLLAIIFPFLDKFVKDTANPYDDQLIKFVEDWATKNL